jgi:hypothetical protein
MMSLLIRPRSETFKPAVLAQARANFGDAGHRAVDGARLWHGPGG